MARLTLTIDTDDDTQADRLVEELRTAATNGEGITIHTAGGQFTVDADRVVPSSSGDYSDSYLLDTLALGLGTRPEWPGADTLTWVANVIGQGREHPGDADPVAYVQRFTATHGIDPSTSGLLEPSLSEAYADAVEEARPRCRECREPVEDTDVRAGFGRCGECLHDAPRSGWNPGQDA